MVACELPKLDARVRFPPPAMILGVSGLTLPMSYPLN